MKWTVRHPEAKGKAKSESAPPPSRAQGTIIDVPDGLRQHRPRVGEPFTVSIGTKTGCPLEAETVTCCFLADGKSLLVGDRVVRMPRDPLHLKQDTFRLRVGLSGLVRDQARVIERVRPVQPKQARAASGCGDLVAPMTGKVIKVAVTEAQCVNEGDILVIIEAMKMENQIRAETEGVVGQIKVSEGSAVKVGDLLLSLCAPSNNNNNNNSDHNNGKGAS